MTHTATGRTFLLPDLGEGLTEAEIVRWFVTEGEQVAIDETIVEVETAKSVVEVPSPYAGVVLTLHAAEGETVEVGKPLITVGSSTAALSSEDTTRDAERYREEEQAGSGNVLIGYGTSGHGGSGRRRRPKSAATAATAAPAPTPAADASRAAPEAAAAPAGPVLVVSPLVRRLAADHGVDLRALKPTGPGGLIMRADVEDAISRSERSGPTLEPAGAAAPASTGVGERRVPLNGFRKAVSTALSRSRSEIPEATVWVDVDATALVELRASVRTATDPGPGLLAYIARFVVAGLQQYPVLNSRLDTERDEIVELDQINLGIAVQGERGLVVPAIANAGALKTYELDAGIRDVTERARLGKVTAEELASGTFTLNNYGSFRVDGSAAIINHPQVAILGFGRIIDRPWVVGGQILARKITQMSFVFDHRVCDGGNAAGFMRTVADAIEDPASAIARM
ncbi:dihydrolipoamide acetyltransferase family protein (plasmid) [Nocardioides sp. R1-1]|uniref:dihydrolipoamide acetyltransferase family protein n=1 Tax=Nocardioides sp. R1-1 TaxID=3383502 RepID=UPI0038CFD83D